MRAPQATQSHDHAHVGTAPAAGTRPSVVVIQRLVPHYREAFFRRLEAELATRGIALALRGGQAREEECQVECLDRLPFAERCPNRYLSERVYWQRGALRDLGSADLTIVEQANGALINYPLLVRRQLGLRSPLVAFWGHGRNLHTGQRERLRSAWKHLLLPRVDWWFAYTGLTKDVVASSGFPADRITVVNNAIDTVAIRRQAAAVSDADVRRLRRELFGEDAEHAAVGAYCGRLYSLRRIPFMLAACDRIHAELPNFRMVTVGAGPDASAVREFAASRPWFRHVGERYGADLVPYLKLADAFLMPGMIGLNILDAFAIGLPVCTTDCGIHSPEIAYLEHDRNGIMTQPDVEAYAQGVAGLLSSPDRLRSMRTAAAASGMRYSTASMASAFADGVASCLARHGHIRTGALPT